MPNAIQYIGSATGITSVTIPTHQKGDLLVAYIFRDGSTSPPTIPVGWTGMALIGGNSCWGGLYYRTAGAPGTTSGTWTSATGLIVSVYRNAWMDTNTFVDWATSGTATSVTYSATIGSFAYTDGTSWATAGAGHRSINTTLENPPTGMTNRVDYLDGVNEVVAHDTNGGVTAWTSQAVAVGGTASGWATFGAEIQALNNYCLDPVNGASTNAPSLYSRLLNISGSFVQYWARGNLDRAGSKRFASYTSVSAKDIGIGIASENSTGGTVPGADAASFMLQANGTVRLNNATVGTSISFVTGDVIDMAYDDINKVVWYRKNGGNWNGNATHDPTTNVGGISVSGLNGTQRYALAFTDNTSPILNCNFGASAFTYAMPSGYQSFETSVTTYNQSASASSTSTSANTKSAGKPIATTSTSASSLVKQAGKIVSLTGTSASAILKQATKLFSISTATTETAVKSAGKKVSTTSTSSSALLTSLVRVMIASTSRSTGVAVSKSAGKVFAVATATTEAATKAIAKAAVVASTSTTAVTRLVSKKVVATGTSIATAAKTAGKFFSTALATTETAATSIRRVLAASAASTSTTSTSKRAGKVVAVVSTTVGASIKSAAKKVVVTSLSTTNILRAMTKVLAVSSTSVSTAIKSATKTFSTSVASSASIVYGKSYLTFLSATVSSTSALRLSTGKVATIAVGSAKVVSKAVSKSVAVASVSVLSVIKTVTHPIVSLSVASTASNTKRVNPSFNTGLSTASGGNLFTQSEFANGLADAPTRGGLITATTFSGLTGSTGLAFGYDGSTVTFAYKTGARNYAVNNLSVFVTMDDGLGPPVFGSSNAFSALNDFVLIVTAVIPSPLTYTVTSFGGGLYRVSVTYTTTITNGSNGIIKYGSHSSRTFKTSGYQISVGATLLPYIATTTSNVGPLISIFKSVGKILAVASSIGSGGNQLSKSQQLDDAVWVKDEMSVTADAATAIDGTLTADLVIPSINSSTTHRIRRPTPILKGAYAYSVYAKAAGYSRIKIRDTNSYANFNLATGVVETTGNGSGIIENVGNGWYRCTLTSPNVPSVNLYLYVTTTDDVSLDHTAYAGNGTSGVYFWGAQFEDGVVPTPYVPTTTVAVAKTPLVSKTVMKLASIATASLTAVTKASTRTLAVASSTLTSAIKRVNKFLAANTVLIGGGGNLYVGSGVSGAVVGTIGSGGALPTGWGVVAPNGLVIEVQAFDAVNYETGLPGILIRASGTSSSTGTFRIQCSPATFATVGVTYSTAQYAKQTVGSTPIVITLVNMGSQWTIPTSGTLLASRNQVAGPIVSSALRNELRFNTTLGQVYDQSFVIGPCQLSLGPVVGAYIPTTSAASPPTLSVANSVLKRLATAVTTSTAVSFIKAFVRTMVVTAVSTTSIVKSAGKRILAASTSVSQASKAVSKKVLAVSTSASSSIKRSAKTAQAVLSGAVTTSFKFTFVLAATATVSSVTTSLKVIGKKATAICSTLVNRVSSKIFRLVLAAASSTTSTISKRVGKTVSTVVSTLVSFFKVYLSRTAKDRIAQVPEENRLAMTISEDRNVVAEDGDRVAIADGESRTTSLN